MVGWTCDAWWCGQMKRCRAALPQRGRVKGLRMQERLPRIDASIVALDPSQLASLGLLDHAAVDWGRVKRSVYLIHQNFHYEYPGPIADLNHRLVVLPPNRHGDQRRLGHRLDVSVSPAEVDKRRDAFGNIVLDLHVPFVETAIDFEAWIVVERSPP